MERRKEQRRKRDENHLRDDKLCGCYPSCRFHRRSGADRRATETAKPEIPPEVFAEIERQHKEMDAATGVTPELAAMKFKQPAPASPPDEKCGRGIWLGKASYNCELPKYHEGSCSPTPPATAVQPPAPPDTPAAAPNGGRDDLRKKSCDVWNPQQRASVFIRTAIPNIGDVLMMTCEPSGNRIFLSDILGEYQQWLERASVPTLAPSTPGDSREQFEKWLTSEEYRVGDWTIARDGDRYRYDDVRQMWRAWQAAAARKD